MEAFQEKPLRRRIIHDVLFVQVTEANNESDSWWIATYPLKAIASLDKNMWWKHADIGMTFIVSSIADPKDNKMQVKKRVKDSVRDRTK